MDTMKDGAVRLSIRIRPEVLAAANEHAARENNATGRILERWLTAGAEHSVGLKVSTGPTKPATKPAKKPAKRSGKRSGK